MNNQKDESAPESQNFTIEHIASLLGETMARVEFLYDQELLKMSSNLRNSARLGVRKREIEFTVTILRELAFSDENQKVQSLKAELQKFKDLNL